MQAAEMSCYSVAEEIMPGRADYLAGDAGIKPATLADRSRARGIYPSNEAAIFRPMARAWPVRLDSENYRIEERRRRLPGASRFHRRTAYRCSARNS